MMEEIKNLKELREKTREIIDGNKIENDCKKRQLLLQYLGFEFQNEANTQNIMEWNGNEIEGAIDWRGNMVINEEISIKVHVGEPTSEKKDPDNEKQLYYIILCDGNKETPYICFGYGTEKEKLDEFKNEKHKYTNDRIDELEAKLKEIIMGNRSDSREEKDVINIIKKNIQIYKQVIFTGAPGTGKTYGVRKVVEDLCEGNTERMKFVQFHPSYDYTDFVEGLRPVKLEGDKETTFVRLDGIFKKFCRIAATDQVNNYYFVADEINRADLSKVFGELMFGLEESKRGKKFDTQYMNLPSYEVKDEVENKVKKKVAREIEEDVFADGFFIPENLYFIGTMNDIDRSVESFDFALRRRFRWVEIEADAIMETSLRDMLGKKDGITDDAIKELTKNVKALNETIENSDFGLTKAYHIGPAYFEGFNGENGEDIFVHRIEPLLREYTRGRDSENVNNFIKACRDAFLNSSEDK